MCDLHTPEWRDIPGYEGIYRVSSCGEIFSVKRQRERKAFPTARGKHLRLTLSKDGRTKNFRVHQLVLLAFVGEKPIGLVSRHLNGNGFDNHVTNLAYGTHSENAIDRVLHGHDARSKTTHCPRGHELTDENTYRDKKNCRSCLKCRRDYYHRQKGGAN